MKVRDYANLPAESFVAIEAELRDQASIPDLLHWSLEQPSGALLPEVIAELIEQDEFTHDLVVPWRNGLVLVYGAT